jgi:hypothetical protein
LNKNHTVGEGHCPPAHDIEASRPAQHGHTAARFGGIAADMVKRLEIRAKNQTCPSNTLSPTWLLDGRPTMTDIQRPNAADGNALFAGLVKGGALAGTLTWALILLSFLAALAAPSGGGLNALGPLLALIVATPVFFIFVLPALLFSFLGGQSGAKVGAGFLVSGLLVVAVVFAGPILRVIS